MLPSCFCIAPALPSLSPFSSLCWTISHPGTCLSFRWLSVSHIQSLVWIFVLPQGVQHLFFPPSLPGLHVLMSLSLSFSVSLEDDTWWSRWANIRHGLIPIPLTSGMETIKASVELLEWSYKCPLSHFMTSSPLKENPTAESSCRIKRFMGFSRMLMQIQDIIFCFCELILIQCSGVLGNVWMTQFGNNRLQPTLEILFYKCTAVGEQIQWNCTPF